MFRALPLSLRTKKYLKYFYFRGMAALGIERSPALNDLDRKLAVYLPARGVFVEAGANDGVSQSNTWHLERYRGWTGLLIEPVPALAALARRFRSAPVVQAALGPIDGGFVTLAEADLMTAVRCNATGIDAPQRTLSSLLDEHRLATVDFLSLDVEGFELEVLRGLDLVRHAPSFILIETADFDAVQAALASHYDFVAALSHHDYLFRRRADHPIRN